MNTFGYAIPSNVALVLRSGKIIEAFYDKKSGILFGMQELFRQTTLSLFEILVFTYNGEGVFDVSVFSTQCVEKPLLDNVMNTGTLYLNYKIHMK